MRTHTAFLVSAAALIISSAAAAQTQPVEQKGAPATTPAVQKQEPGATSATGTSAMDRQTTAPATAPGQAGSTPGQTQTTPGQASQLTPAVTGETPSGQATGTAAAGTDATTAGQTQAPQLTAATAADVKAGVSVYDQKGGLIGKIVSSTAKGAVVDTGSVRAAIPVSSFAKSDKGLVVATTKAEIDASAKASAKQTTTKKK